MSGHSKWKQIKHKKAANDQRRSKVFSKHVKVIAIAARDEANPEFNPRLRAAIDRARAANMPSGNIERAIKKASEAKDLEEITIEAYGAGGIAVIARAITDNKNRTIPELKHLVGDKGGKWAETGSVDWAFDGDTPKFPQEISDDDKQKLQKLLDALEEHDDISSVLHNAKVD